MFFHPLFVRILAVNLLLQCYALPISREIIRNIKASGCICVLLQLPGVDWEDISSWSRGLTFPVQVWTRLGHQQIQSLKNYNAFNRKVVVIVPSSSSQQRIALQEKLGEVIMFIPLVRLFVLKSGDAIPNDYPRDVSCALIYLNETTIDVPEDTYRNCTKRTAMNADRLFKIEEIHRWTKLKGTSVVGCTKYVDILTGSNYDYQHSSYGPALMDAYRHLNISFTTYISNTRYQKHYAKLDQILLDVLHKKIDITFYPTVCSEPYRAISDVSSFTHMARMVFYTAESKRRSPSLRFGFATLYASWYLGILAIMILAIHFFRGRILHSPTSTYSMALLLYALVFGKYTYLGKSLRNAITCLLLAFWSVGGFFLSAYIQSDLTSVASVPTLSKLIETIDDFDRVIKLKKIRPCVVRNLFVHQYIMWTNSGVLGTLRNSLIECGEGCLQNYGTFDCFEKIRRGTHGMIFVESKSVPEYMEHPGLSPGIDNFGIFPMAFMTSKAFPYLQEHHQIVGAIIEMALYVPFQKKANCSERVESATQPREIMRFRIMLLLGCGCCLSLLVFLVELIIRPRCSGFNQELSMTRGARRRNVRLRACTDVNKRQHRVSRLRTFP